MAAIGTLKVERGRLKASLTKLKNFIENVPASKTYEEIQLRLEKIDEIFNDFKRCDDILVANNVESEFDIIEDKYFEIKGAFLNYLQTKFPKEEESLIQSDLNPLNSTVTQLVEQQKAFLQKIPQPTCSTKTLIKLPKTDLPTFSGDYKDWPSFKDLFSSTVDKNDTLSPAAKLQYLKGALKGEANTLIKHLSITDNHYAEAWSKLVKRYDKKRQILSSYIKSFINIQSCTNVSYTNSTSLRRLVDTADQLIRGIDVLGEEAKGRDPWLNFIILSKLDSDTLKAWAEENSEHDFPTFNSLLEFLNNRCDALETCDPTVKRTSSTTHARNLHISTSTCVKCSQIHSLFKCPEFSSMNVPERRKFVESKSLCFNCLNSGHSAKSCKSNNRCHRCGKLHHTTLHQNHAITHSKATTQQSPSTLVTSKNMNNSTVLSHSTESHVDSFFITKATPSTVTLLPTAVVNVKDLYGNLQPCRILLDSGSQASFISEQCSQQLRLHRNKANLIVHGVASTKGIKVKGKITLHLQSRFLPEQHLKVQVYILKRLTSPQPATSFQFDSWHLLNSYDMADPHFYKSNKIDIILGADCFFQVVKDGQHSISKVLPPLQNTIFGYVIAGQVHIQQNTNHTTSLHIQVSDTDVDQTLKKFWEIEEIPTNNSSLTEEEELCESHFRNSHYVDPVTQRYVVRLPFKAEAPILGQSLAKATSCLHTLERKFLSNPHLKNEYSTFMNEYKELGHMLEIPQSTLLKRCEHVYFPHHPVIKPSSTTTKLRVVFNGSSSTSNGISLNQKLLVGPKTQRDLIAILLSFRTFRVAVVADIEKMYRQVLVDPLDRDYQRILWRDNQSDLIRHYHLTTVTYGTSSAPYLATRALKQLTIEFNNQFPLAESALLNNFYVDDLLSGAESLEDAIELHTQLTVLLNKRGFSLRKWQSNSYEFLSKITNDCYIDTHHFTDKIDNGTKVLGLQWLPQEDCFTFDVNLRDNIKTTKRSILSESSRIFDPLGLISPITISFKILLQQLWLKNYDWDDECIEFQHKWTSLRSNLHLLRNLRVKRYVPASTLNVQLHGFADASETAYAAVVYCRSINENGSITTTLIASKTKVCPIKQVSIPRLELCAALLVTKLIKFISSNLNISIEQCFTWTDSMIVLSWLSSHPRKWKCFVGNRTSQILSIISRPHWNHISSSSNPADLATRNITVEQLLNSRLWWNGPECLQHDWQNNINMNIKSSVEEVDKELRKKYIESFHISTSNHSLSLLFMKFSSLTKIINVISKCFHFIRCCKLGTKNVVDNTWVNAHDIKHAYFSCIKWAQSESFGKELQDLKSKRQIQSSSQLLKLTPFLDQHDILRVGGRIDNSNVSYDTKHPPILPKDHIFVKYLIQQLHERYFHADLSLLLSIIRQRYWIISCRMAVKACIKSCVICAKRRIKTSEQLMANLPKHRVNVYKPFEVVGIDYAGPFTLLLRRGRGAKTTKGYLVIFVCFCTRAIHIELAGDLTTETFISSLKRFSSRRGLPSVIYSDNGTNFVGAKRYLTELDNLMKLIFKDNSLYAFLSSNSITWKFNPPSSPHFGGLWEAGVKVIKSCLKRVIGETKLTYEEMNTALIQIEGLLNSRPLVPIRDDHSDLNVLTPAHFLVGQPLTTVPELPIESSKLPILERWRIVQNIHQHFWKRWHLEYLNSLQQRPKWHKVQPNLQIGDLIVVKENNMPPAKWLLGRVVETHAGQDNITRVVTIKTAQGLFKRPSIKLCKLPVNEYDS